MTPWKRKKPLRQKYTGQTDVFKAHGKWIKEYEAQNGVGSPPNPASSAFTASNELSSEKPPDGPPNPDDELPF